MFVLKGSQVCRLVDVSTTKLLAAGPLRPKPNWLLVNPGAPGSLVDITAKAAGALTTPVNPLLMATV